MIIIIIIIENHLDSRSSDNLHGRQQHVWALYHISGFHDALSYIKYYMSYMPFCL